MIRRLNLAIRADIRNNNAHQKSRKPSTDAREAKKDKSDAKECLPSLATHSPSQEAVSRDVYGISKAVFDSVYWDLMNLKAEEGPRSPALTVKGIQGPIQD